MPAVVSFSSTSSIPATYGLGGSIMKKVLLSLAAAAALAGAVTPAAAQSYGGYDRSYDRGYERGDRGYDRGDRGVARRDNLEWRISRGERDGSLNPREATRLREQLRITDRIAWRYRADGMLTGRERADLDQRYAELRREIRYQSNDRDYGYGYGYRR
jgi:hypothetical protein